MPQRLSLLKKLYPINVCYSPFCFSTKNFFCIHLLTVFIEHVVLQENLVQVNVTTPAPVPPESPPLPLPSKEPKVEPYPDLNVPSRPDVTGVEIPFHCKQDEFVIHSKKDLDSIIDCEVIVGDIKISEYNYPIITFPQLFKLVGNLIIKKSPELVRIELPVLETITSSFIVNELTSLALISSPNLKSLRVLDWTILPILSNVHFNNEIEGLESITLSDTSLTGFSGFVADTLETLDINNNRFLDNIECNVRVVRGKLHIASNANDVKVSLPHLRQVNKLSINSVETLTLDELENVQSSLSLSNNYFQQLRFPKLSEIGGTLSLLKNENVNHLEFPVLNEIGGGLMFINNTKIERINFFPKLTIIGGALELIGSIKEIHFKQLKLVKGSAIVKSSSYVFDCSVWAKSEILFVVRGGKIECTNANNEVITSKTRKDGGEVRSGGSGSNGGSSSGGNGKSHTQGGTLDDLREQSGHHHNQTTSNPEFEPESSGGHKSLAITLSTILITIFITLTL